MDNTLRKAIHQAHRTLSRRLMLGLAISGLLTLTACSETPPEQLSEEFGIAYIKRPVTTDTGTVVLANADLREVLAFTEGGDIWYRDIASPSAPERNITACITQGVGDVRDLSTSYDGNKIIFSLHRQEPNPNNPRFTWDIYEYDTATGDCPTRVIRSDLNANKGDDLMPSYLPDGRIVFSSTRQKGSGAVLTDEGKSRFRALDERRREQAPVLHVMSASGNNIDQITFNQSHDLYPSVLSTGEILFTRWDNMGSRNAMNLYKVRPDGTELKAVYGMHQHNVGSDGSTVQYTRPRQMEDGRVLVMLKPYSGSAGSGSPAIIDIANYVDNRQPTWANQGVLGGSAQSTAIDLDVRTDGNISPAGRFRDVNPLWDGSNRALVSWSQCRLLDSNGRITPCPDNIPADAVEATPLYGIYIFDMDKQTQLPVVIPSEGTLIEEPVVAAPRSRPVTLYDKAVGFELDQTLAEEGVGLLHIRSVYDIDGRFDPLGSTAVNITNLSELADPTRASADQRRVRFLRIVKAVPIPDRDTLNFDRSAFGRSRAQGMREIIGYAPVQPDGSVLVKVPANVPLAISLVDKEGRRIRGRHQNWLQLRAGESLTCNGCHDHNPASPGNGLPAPLPLPHGTAGAATPVNTGAPTTGAAFIGTDPSKLAEMGETMAQTRIRLACGAANSSDACSQLSPSVDLMFDDEWTDPAATPTPSIYLRYADTELAYFGTNAPAKPTCQTRWSANCRTIINYIPHIHPLWSQPRTASDGVTDRTCTSCHSDSDAGGALRVPVAQLDLGDGPSDQNADHYKSYRELLFNDNRQILNDNGILVDETVDVPLLDADGNPVFLTAPVTDPVTGEVTQVPVLDANGDPIPLTTPVPVRAAPPSMSTNGARSSAFISKFLDPADSHFGDLSATELRLIAEWLDIGAQYFNNPSDPGVPLN